MAVTIKDIAEAAEVSITTVSRVLNDKPDVSSPTRRKVIKKINELGYKPNSIARGLALQKTNTLGLIIPDISNPFFPDIARGVEDTANKKGYSVIFCNTDNKEKKEKEAIELMKEKQVDGILLSLSKSNKNELKNLRNIEYPIVQIDRKIPDINYPSIIIDNVQSAYNATQYLIKNNHRKIAHITGDLKTITGSKRLKGFKKAMTEYNLDLKKKYIKQGDYSKESGYKNMIKLLKTNNPPSAVFIANDLMAVGAYQAVFELNLSIPKEISIIGHDNIDFAKLVNPSLSTMNQPKYKLGSKAVNLLIKEIENNSLSNEEIILPTKLINRNSIRRL